eukprot:6187008-Pleurochrysis_carterae.AAC.1
MPTHHKTTGQNDRTHLLLKCRQQFRLEQIPCAVRSERLCTNARGTRRLRAETVGRCADPTDPTARRCICLDCSLA